MARKIQHKRGLEKNLPTLAPGEFALTTDTKKVFIGTDNGNVEVTNKEAVENVTEQLAEMPKTVNNISPDANGNIQIEVPDVDTTNLATKHDIQQLSLTFKESYATLTELQTAYPNGDNTNHVVLADNMIYTYKNEWISTGIQANGTGVANGTVTPSKLSDSVVKRSSYNLYDKSKAVNGKIIHNTPTQEAANYADGIFSGLVPVQTGTYLITQPFRAIGAIFAWDETVKAPEFRPGAICAETAGGAKYGTWTLDKTKMQRVNKTINGDFAVQLTISDPNIKYIGWHMHSDAYWPHTPQQFNDLISMAQVVEGSVEKPYAPYGVYKLEESLIPDRIMTAINEISSPLRGDIAVVKQGNNLSVRVPWDSNNDLYTLWNIDKNLDNNNLNMVGLYTCSKNTPLETIDGVPFKTASDDVTPLQLNVGYEGANHGFDSLEVLTASGHGKTTADIGSVWNHATDGNFILMDVVNANTLHVLYDYSGVTTYTRKKLTASTGQLTHVSGATNTPSISYTAKTSQQLRPNINKKVITLVLDNKEVTEEGVFRGQKFDLVESYNITSLAGISEYAKANKGSALNLDNPSIPVWIGVNNVFTHGRNGSLTVKTGYEYFGEATITGLGIVQSQIIGNKAYVPNVGTVSGLDLSTVVTQGTTTLSFYKSTWIDQTKPPYRYHQFADDMSKGMALGYNTQIGLGKPSIRSANSGAGNFFGTTKKMYPEIHSGTKVMPAGSYQEAVAFRVPLKVIDSDATCLYWYWVGNDIYLAFDYHKDINKMIELPSYMAGKKVEQLDVHANTTIQSEIVSAKGIKVKIVNNYGYGVLRLYD